MTPITKGQRFGRLIVQEHAKGPNGFGHAVTCLCDCGNKPMVRARYLVSGKTTSCGCYQRESARQRELVHGSSGTVEYQAWSAMKTRCYNTADKAYRRYGGRGIRVSGEWRDSFAAFAAHVGRRPTKEHSIHRIDNNGHYEPGNVKWATRLEQAQNKHSTRLITYNGDTASIAEWSRRLGIRFSTLWARLFQGQWDIHRAFTVPIRVWHRR